MDIEIHKNNLKKYIEEDMAFKEPLKNISDFDKYCYNHCLDIKEVLSELDKKDKIINELEDIFYNYQLCEYELTDCTYRKCEYIADDENPPCKECIKQYFERKVENGN